MLTPIQGGGTRFDLVKEGAIEFINQFKFVPPSNVALISFGSTMKLESDFRNTRPPLITAIQNIKPQGATLYDPPLLDSNVGAIKLLSKMDPGVRRVVIFLTDGDPNKTPSTNQIIQLCKQNNIIMYSIAVDLPMNADLSQISGATGGKAFSVSSTQREKLKEIYRLIALETIIKNSCTLEWIAPYGCSEQSRTRTLNASFKRTNPPLTTQTEYTAPDTSIGKVTTRSSVYFGDPSPNQQTTQQLSIKAVNAPLRVDSTYFVPSQFFAITNMDGRSYPFVINPGDEWKPTVTFTQGSLRDYRIASLVMFSSPCPPAITVFGGLANVQVVSPNGGEIVSTCDSLDIKWAGVETSQPVIISVAKDGDAPNPTWTIIGNGVSGLSYKWRPTEQGTKYKVRITTAPQASYNWANSIGDSGLDTCKSVSMDAQGLYAYIAGTFSGTASFGKTDRGVDVSQTTSGGQDMFVAKYDPAGNIVWAKKAGGDAEDRYTCVTNDNTNGVYAAGFFASQSIMVNDQSIPITRFDQRNVIISKYDDAGVLQWTRTGNGPATNNTNSQCFATVTDIAYGTDGKLYATGQYKNVLRMNGLPVSPGYLQLSYVASVGGPEFAPFTAVFDANGALLQLIQARLAAPYTTATITDKNGNRYETGAFTGTLNSGTLRNNSKGGFDVYLRKFGGQPASADVSDNVFNILAPVLQFNDRAIDVGKISQFLTTSKTFIAQLCNKGQLPVSIKSTSIAGRDKGDFTLVSNLTGVLLMPGECKNVEISFTPAEVGNREALLYVNTDCTEPALVQVIGEGLLPCKFSPSNPFIGSSPVGIQKNLPEESCLIRNDGSSNTRATMRIAGVNADEFKVTLVKSGCEVNSTNAAGCQFALDPRECLSVRISFTPTGSGNRSAVLNVEVPGECGSLVEIPLNGFGVAANVTVSNMDWGFRRVNTTNAGKVKITNNDTVDANITNVDFTTAGDANFTFVGGKPAVPFTLAKGGAFREFDVTYTPQAEATHTNGVKVSVAGNSTDAQGRLSGDGFIPDIIAADTSFQPAPVNRLSPEQIGFIVKNGDTKVPLQIVSMAFDPPTTEFYFENGAVSNTSIPANQELPFPIRFRPSGPGLRIATIKIISDANAAPDSTRTTIITISGIGLQTNFNSITPFGDVLSCDTTQTKVVELVNPTNVPMNVTTQLADPDAVIEQTPAGTAFIVQPNGGRVTWTLRYKPKAGNLNATFTVNTPVDTAQFVLSGRGIQDEFKLSSKNVDLPVGGTELIPLTVNTSLIQNFSGIRTLSFKATYDNDYLRFTGSGFNANSGGFTWTVDSSRITNGEVILNGVSMTGLANGDVTLFNLPFTMYHTMIPSFTVDFTWLDSTIYSCLRPTTAQSVITSGLRCYSSGTQVNIGNGVFQLNVKNTRNSADMTAEFNLAFDAPYSLDVMNSVGERVFTTSQAYTTAGIHSIPLRMQQLANGVYYVRLQSLWYSEVIPVLIAQ
ncbi:MAG: choice-of-anchor D domain-containing protein [Candidatus Kapabacteria bacterium]|nr:choice-of-anchor D domain-containing protein [Candidatus Kapabacteria bacterium]